MTGSTIKCAPTINPTNTERASEWQTPPWLREQIDWSAKSNLHRKGTRILIKSYRFCVIKDADVLLSPLVSPRFLLKPVKLKRTWRWSIFVQISIRYSLGPAGLIHLQNQVAVSLCVAFAARQLTTYGRVEHVKLRLCLKSWSACVSAHPSTFRLARRQMLVRSPSCFLTLNDNKGRENGEAAQNSSPPGFSVLIDFVPFNQKKWVATLTRF